MTDDTTTKKAIDKEEKKISGFSPLNHSIFRYLWFATIGYNIGSAMHDAGELWLMTNLTQ